MKSTIIIISVLIFCSSCYQVDRDKCKQSVTDMLSCKPKPPWGNHPIFKYDLCSKSTSVTTCIGCESYVEFLDLNSGQNVEITIAEFARKYTCDR